MNKLLLLFSAFLYSQCYYGYNHTNYVDTSSVNLSFEENKGQFSDQFNKVRSDILYGGNTGQMSFYIKNKGISYQLYKVNHYRENENPLTDEKSGDIREQVIYRIDIHWLNTNASSGVIAGELIPGTTNYYLEQCPTGITNVHSYKDITLKNLYNNIDLHYYQKQGSLKYDYIVAPHANYKQIKLEVKGAQISLQRNGSLLLITPFGKVEEKAPLVYQNGRQLKAWYKVTNNIISFEIEHYDAREALIIDPLTRAWGTYYGGTGEDSGISASTDAAGNVYLAGYSNSTGTLIATTGAHQNTNAGGTYDGYLAKFNGSGVRQWSTFYGGSATDIGYSCHVDISGDVYMAGYSNSGSSTVIATPGAYQSVFGGGNWDGFLAKFNNSGVRLWGTFYGDAGEDRAYSCSTDLLGNVFLTGYSNANSGSVISTPGSHQAFYGGGSCDAFLVKFTSGGTRQWGTYYGGNGEDKNYYCCTDKNGNVYTAGTTDSNSGGTEIASVGAHQTTYGGGLSEAYLVKFDGAGVRQWSTYYGGTNGDQGYSCATDVAGNVYLSGNSEMSTGTVIATLGAHQSIAGGIDDAFLVKFNSAGVRQWGTYYGGLDIENSRCCCTDQYDNVYLTGGTISGNNIASNGFQNTYSAGGNSTWDVFLVKFNSSGIRQWGTYYGANAAYDFGNSCVADLSGSVYMAGYSLNANTGLASPGSHQSVFGGNRDGILVKFACIPLGPVAVAPTSLCEGSSLNFTGSVTNNTQVTSYLWQGPGNFMSMALSPSITVASISNSGTYTFTVNDGMGCSEYTTVSVSINPLPVILVSGNNAEICQGQSVTLNVSGASTYSWSTGETVPGITISPTVTSTYTVTGISSQGCSITHTLVQLVNTCTDVHTYIKNLNNAELYPNPNNGTFTFNLNKACNISILNIAGQTIYKESMEAGVYSLNFGNISKSLYLVIIDSGTTIKTFKMVIQ